MVWSPVHRLRGAGILILALGWMLAPSAPRASAARSLIRRVGGSGGGSGEGEVSPQALASPFLETRRAAVERGGPVGDLERLLADPDHRVRAEAARIGCRSAAPGTPASGEGVALVARALARERDRVTRVAMAEALAPHGRAALAAMESAGRDGPHAAPWVKGRRALIRAVVVEELRRIQGRITDATGEVKGLYRAPFAGIAALGPEAGPAVVEIVANPGFHDSIRALAARACGDLDLEESLPELRRVHGRLAGAMRRLEESRLDGARVEPWDDHLLRAAMYSLYRMGVPGPFAAWQKLLRGWATDRRSDFVDNVHFRFRLAYNLQQVREYEGALREYERLLDDVEWSGLPWMAQTVSYNLACIHSLEGDTATALRFLGKAVAWGFRDREWADRDADLDALRGAPGFREILERMK